jgi:hypothetical protein
MGTGVTSRGKAVVVKLNSRVAHRLRNRGGVPLIRLYVIIAWRGTTSPIPSLLNQLSLKFYTTRLVIKIVIKYAEFLHFLFRNLTSQYSSYDGKISININ